MAAGPASLSPSETDPPDTPPGPPEAPNAVLLAAVLAGCGTIPSVCASSRPNRAAAVRRNQPRACPPPPATATGPVPPEAPWIAGGRRIFPAAAPRSASLSPAAYIYPVTR